MAVDAFALILAMLGLGMLFARLRLLPADPAYAKYFRDGGADGKDNLHPNGLGHLRIAQTIAAALRALPPGFRQQPASAAAK